MKSTKITHTIAVIATIIAASCIMTGTARADYGPHLEITAINPQIYEHITPLWEYFQGTRIQWTTFDETSIEPNDDSLTAFIVEDGWQINGHVDAAGDLNDYFKIVTSGPSTLVTQLKWTGSAWLNLYLYDENLDPITYLNEDTASPKTLSFWQWDAGTYYIRVKAIEEASDYTLKVAIATQYSEPQNDILGTTDLHLSVFNSPFKSVISDSVDPVDFYQIYIPGGCEGATISLDWLGTNDSNLDFDVYGENGYLLFEQAGSSSFEKLYSQNVPEGTYYIAVKAITGRAVYQLTVDAEVEYELEIPHFEYLVPIWSPPFPEFEIEPIMIEQEVMMRQQ